VPKVIDWYEIISYGFMHDCISGEMIINNEAIRFRGRWIDSVTVKCKFNREQRNGKRSYAAKAVFQKLIATASKTVSIVVELAGVFVYNCIS
jgi:hypothetical protein